MNNYNERIASVKEDLTRELNMRELTIVVNKGLGLHIEVETELFTQSLPSLRGDIDEQTVTELRLCKEEIASLLKKILEIAIKKIKIVETFYDNSTAARLYFHTY